VNYDWIEQELQSFVDAIDCYKGRVNKQGHLVVPAMTEGELLQRSAACGMVLFVSNGWSM